MASWIRRLGGSPGSFGHKLRGPRARSPRPFADGGYDLGDPAREVRNAEHMVRRVLGDHIDTQLRSGSI